MADTEFHDCLIPAELAGARLDQALVILLPGYSRSRLQKWIRDGHVTVEGRRARPRDLVSAGVKVQVRAVSEPDDTVVPEPISLDIVYQDEAILVVNKPAGLVVHPGAGNRRGTLQNALLHRLPRLAELPRSGIVHRLDKETSGLLVVACSLVAHNRLVTALQAHQFEREYEAVVSGLITAGGQIDAPIGRHQHDRIRMAVREGGRAAVTHYRVLERFRAHTRVAVHLETGRTHQIRVHFAHIRHPLVGDPVYGRRLQLPAGASQALRQALQDFRRQALHARRLSLAHPLSGEPMAWEAPPPEDFATLLACLRADVA